MKPFSPLYFIKENKMRCILMIFMVFLSFGIYFGGLYVSNLSDNWVLPITYREKMTTVGGTTDDYTDFIEFREKMEADERVTVLEMGAYSGMKWGTIMGFQSGMVTFTFKSVEDFKVFCEYMGINCDCSALSDKSFVLSRRMADNKGLKLGDVIDKSFEEGIYDSYTLDALTDEDGYMQYYINSEETSGPSIMLLCNGIESNELFDIVYTASEGKNVSVFDNLRKTITDQFSSFNMIYSFTVVLLSLILAVTINAAFIGMYQKREYEFAVYRGIGISRRKIVGKIVGELLTMDLLALIIGGGVFFLFLYLFNSLVLYPVGLYLRYFDPLAVFGLLFCNIMVILPLIFTRRKQMLKADICEY